LSDTNIRAVSIGSPKESEDALRVAQQIITKKSLTL
jgi:hypothetical protein